MITQDIVKKITRIFFAFIFVFLVSFFVLPTDNVSAGLDCPTNFDDCDCNGSCELDVSSNPYNCGKCGNVCSSKNCVSGSCVPVVGGLVPCGRSYDNPDTIWNEQESCQICHTIPLANNIIDYLVGIVGLISVLFIIIAGIISATSMGSTNALNLAKTAVSKSLYGFVFVLIAWLIVNIGMVVFGFDDPMGDGSWAKVECNLITNPINRICGDGLVDSPNSNGINEVCDPTELKNDFITRKSFSHPECINSDSNCPIGCYTSIDNDCINKSDSAAWIETIYACNSSTCQSGCDGSTQIGKGCYLDLNNNGITDATECQKGRYVCDFNTDTVICQNTFNDPDYSLAGDYCSDIFDACCDNTGADFKNGTLTSGVDFDQVRATSADLIAGAGPVWDHGALQWTASTFLCEDICRNSNKICIGVGLGDPTINPCISVMNDAGGNCDNAANQALNNCTAHFSLNGGSCNDSAGWPFVVLETLCYCM